ncbi:hypothetical protein B0H14DRAFT_3033726, partial [Mycena olivaceomarginata]
MPSCAFPSNHRGTDHLGLSFSFFTALFSPKTLLETSTPLWPLPDVLLFMSSCLIPSKANYAAARQRPLAHPTLHLSHLLRILGPRRRRSTSTSWATPHLHLYPSTRRGSHRFSARSRWTWRTSIKSKSNTAVQAQARTARARGRAGGERGDRRPEDGDTRLQREGRRRRTRGAWTCASSAQGCRWASAHATGTRSVRIPWRGREWGAA